MNICFDESIRRLRKQRDLTQEALAEFLGVSFQAVSKWERGESCPDIALLPTIAAFFSVSVDELLGVDKAKAEEEILGYIDKFVNGKYKGTEGTLGFMTEAYRKYPYDFRILVRYMHALVNDSLQFDAPLKNKKEILAIYDRIQNNCTNDGVRIYAKNLLIHYYRPLIDVENSGVTVQDLYDLIDAMPEIQDSKDVLMSSMPPEIEQIEAGCRNLFDGLLFYFDQAVSRFVHRHAPTPATLTTSQMQEAVEGFELVKTIFELVYTDGNYAVNWRNMIYTYGYLGQYYHRLGDDAKALSHLKKCAELAKRFDTMPNITERTALLFKGTTVNKQEDVAVLLDTSVCKQMTHHMLDNYPLSDAFKATPEFQAILAIMQ
ncbi:MAG: helix-turn-helix transcriptional regulator [Clostridia bacterium]|nr:helix-turn-helix transcriptional regulator [Clostridia bacterium]